MDCAHVSGARLVSFLETVERARGFLERHRRVSLRALRREFDLYPETLAEQCYDSARTMRYFEEANRSLGTT